MALNHDSDEEIDYGEVRSSSLVTAACGVRKEGWYTVFFVEWKTTNAIH